MDNKEQLSLVERWNLDVEFYENGGRFRTSTPQCKKCNNFIKGNVLNCKIYGDQEKPKYVLFPNKECRSYESNQVLQVEMKNEYDNKIFGGLFGFFVGDTLGVPVEFSSREEREEDPVKEMRAYGTYHQPFGTWSDDTSLTLCLIESMINNYSMQSVADNFIKYYKSGYLTPWGEVFDIGNATQSAIQRMIRGIEPLECGGKTEWDNGNGSLMRVLPLAYHTKNMLPTERIKMIEDISSLTHGHKRSKFACIFYVQFVINLLDGQEKNEAYKETIEFVNKYCIESYSEELSNYERVLNGKIAFYDEVDIKSSGYIIDTIEAAIWSFLTTDNYTETILKAINLGGDTDTIGAIVGGLAGVYYGFREIPNNWIQILARKEEIYETIVELKKEIL